jgi:hypothetical protein
MPNENLDFWPADLGGGDPDAPVVLLRTQASLLGQKVKSILEARVSTDAFGGSGFRHTFELVVPAISYSYRLFWIQHGVDPYPVTWTLESQQGTLASKEEFTEWLRGTLGSDRTKRIIQTLLAQASG